MEELASHTDASSISRFSRNSSESLCSRGAPSFSSFSLAREGQRNKTSDNASPTGNLQNMRDREITEDLCSVGLIEGQAVSLGEVVVGAGLTEGCRGVCTSTCRGQGGV